MHEFLRSGQYAAAAHDDRVRAAELTSAAGPEVKAAGEIALAGPPRWLRHFLEMGYAKGQQRDRDAETHRLRVSAQIANARRYAADARAAASRAAQSAAEARRAAADALQHAHAAQTAADQAREYATSAQDSAARAGKSAEAAAESAKLAKNAAAAVEQSAEVAQRSALQASGSAAHAQRLAVQAHAAAAAAREDAVAAGASAERAELAHQAALASYREKLRKEELQALLQGRAVTLPSGVVLAPDTLPAARQVVARACDSACSPGCVEAQRDERVDCASKDADHRKEADNRAAAALRLAT
jgi:hypothetical protein